MNDEVQIIYTMFTIIDIGYVQLSRPQSDADEATNPNSRVKEADIADHPYGAPRPKR